MPQGLVSKLTNLVTGNLVTGNLVGLGYGDVPLIKSTFSLQSEEFLSAFESFGELGN